MPDLNPIDRKVVSVWRGLALAYREILRAIIGKGEQPPAGAWEAFLQGFIEGLQWADLQTAQSLRWRGLHEALIIPNRKNPELQPIINANSWAMSHAAVMHPLIQKRAEWIRQVEDTYVTSRAASIRQLLKDPEKREGFRPIYRLDRMRRDALGEIEAVSQQVQLAVPGIGELFPMAQWRTREDARVRSSHAAMANFLALRSYKNWPKLVPPCAWNCRCSLVFRTRQECIKHGWFDAAGRPRFELRWPNSLSESNFENGIFPEWKTERYWSFSGTEPQARVA